MTTAVGQGRGNESIPFVQPKRDDPSCPRVRIGFERCLLDDTPLGTHDYEVVIGKFTHRQEGCYLFTAAQVEEVDDRLAPGSPTHLGKFVHLHPEDSSPIGEKQNIAVC